MKHFSKVFGVGNSHANSQNWIKIELVRDFMPVLGICKFDGDSIKIEVPIILTTFSPLYGYRGLKASNYHVNSLV